MSQNGVSAMCSGCDTVVPVDAFDAAQIFCRTCIARAVEEEVERQTRQALAAEREAEAAAAAKRDAKRRRQDGGGGGGGSGTSAQLVVNPPSPIYIHL